MLSQFMCLTTGHTLLTKQDGSRTYGVCLRCGAETKGWTYGASSADVVGSQRYWDALYSDIMDVELALHGGG